MKIKTFELEGFLHYPQIFCTKKRAPLTAKKAALRHSHVFHPFSLPYSWDLLVTLLGGVL